MESRVSLCIKDLVEIDSYLHLCCAALRRCGAVFDDLELATLDNLRFLRVDNHSVNDLNRLSR